MRGTAPEQRGPVLIAEDDELARELVRELLEREGYRTASAACGESALATARAETPSLALLDVNLPGLSGYEVCSVLRRRFGVNFPIIFVSGERVESYDRVAGLLLGADDYMVKPFAPDELLARVRGLLRRAENGSAVASSLTSRERDVLQLLAEGLEQAEIAEQLVISPRTVATHIERILPKLGVRSRAQAVAAAYRDGLVASA
jgi:DNA-binding NarL/FixJ family response regulator